MKTHLILDDAEGCPQAVWVRAALAPNERGYHLWAILNNYEAGHPMGWGRDVHEAIADLKAEIACRRGLAPRRARMEEGTRRSHRIAGEHSLRVAVTSGRARAAVHRHPWA